MDYTTMTEQELNTVVDEVQQELLRRQNVEAVNREVASVIRRARMNGVAEVPEDGAPWVQPTGAHDAYMAGDVVTHNSKTWVATVDFNVWAPGEAGWREQTADGSPPEWVQPSGAADAYAIGDQVTFNGQVYESVIPSNVWSPADYPQGWEKQ